MTSPPLSAGFYGGDDVNVGDWIDCGSARISANEIVRFAELTGDRFEIHMSNEAAQRHGFARQVAHGLFVLSVVDGLKNQAQAQFRARASKGWEWVFKAPVLADDTISARLSVCGKMPSRHADQTTLELEFTVHNQNSVLVQSGKNLLLVYR